MLESEALRNEVIKGNDQAEGILDKILSQCDDSQAIVVLQYLADQRMTGETLVKIFEQNNVDVRTFMDREFIHLHPIFDIV